MITTILFDLDGTLLPMDQDRFTKAYFANLGKAMASSLDPAELIDAVWAGTKAMIKNDGSVTNETAFWKKYAEIFGEEARAEEPAFANFYEHHFADAKGSCGQNPLIPELIRDLKAAGYKLMVATNPLFPMTAQVQRITWAGLDPNDFVRITSYENSSFCKPNPKYYSEILSAIGSQPDETLMVGNDVRDDMAAKAVGAEVFLLTDGLINSEHADISLYPHGDVPALRDFISASRISA